MNEDPTAGCSNEPPLLDCRDGYRSEFVEKNDGGVEVFLEKIVQGKPVQEPVPVFYAAADDWEERAKARREHHLYAAMCRYLNAGGTFEDIQETLVHLDIFMIGGPQFSLPDGTKLLDVIEEGTHQMLLLDEQEMVTIVTEDEWIDRVPLEHLASRAPDVPVEPYNDDHPSL